MRIYRMPRLACEKNLRTYYHVCALYEGQAEIVFSAYEQDGALFEGAEGINTSTHKKIRIISAPDTLGQPHVIQFYRELIGVAE